jgi:class 3 adenylate cyclase
MPLFMDRHYIEGATHHAIRNAHEKDLDIQDKYSVKFLTYWFDELRCTAFCLVEAPNREVIQQAHAEAHGAIPGEILEVDPTIVEAFLGRVKDPIPPQQASGVASQPSIDSAFRVIMFTDLKDSTATTTRLGDAKALHFIHIHNALTRNALREFGGREVKHLGDGIMATFLSASNAVECAISIQKAFAVHNQQHPDATLHLRLGLSAGEPVAEAGDLFGSAVQLAARLCACAEPDQIVVAQIVRDECQADIYPFLDLGEITLKGFDGAVRVHAVQWRDVQG